MDGSASGSAHGVCSRLPRRAESTSRRQNVQRLARSVESTGKIINCLGRKQGDEKANFGEGGVLVRFMVISI